MAFFRKLRAKARIALRREPSQESDLLQRTESLPPAIDSDRVSGTSKNANRAFSTRNLSLPSLHDRIHEPETQQVEPQNTENQSMNSYLASSPQSLIDMPVPSSTPWEAWTLDQDFLYQFYIWRTKHPEENLNRVFSKLSTAIERHEVLFELVPDGPIPIRGFVKALAHIVKLGVSMADAKVAALQFAQGILQWVGKLADAVGEGGSGRFIAKAWDNLADIRKLIERVCTWAHKMLNVGLVERASVNDKILEFQKEFTHAIEHFGVIANIHIAMGQDHLNRRMDSLKTHVTTGQDRMNQHLEALSQAQSDLVQLVQKPPEPSIPDATYRSQKKIPCDPGTRKQVLNEIMNWISDISEGSPCFFWLSGDPGVGKSAVTASIARECSHRNVLWAQFFINRNDARTVDPQLYFPSIAKQMSACAPAVDHAVRKALETHPYLLNDDISLEQATKLFVDTLRVASAATPTMPVAVVIDALDETDLKRLKVTAEIFSSVLVDLPHNAKVFISSRVENVIRDNFAAHPRVTNIHLSAKNSVIDVNRFLQKRVQEIMTEYHIDWSHWGHQRMRKLCAQASGLFIWAVTAIAYIRSEIEESGRECLDVVLEELNENGMDDINVLYRTILKRTYQRETSPWHMQRFRRIVGGILAQQTPLSIADLQGLLDLRNPKTGTQVDFEHFIRRLRTLLVPGVGEISGQTFPRVHKSFVDFITSAKAEEFRVDLTESNGELALRCIDRLLRLWENEMPPQIRYAVSHWSSHLTHVVGAPVESEETDDDTASNYDAQSVSLNPEKETDVLIPVDFRPAERLADDNRLFSISVSPDRSRIAYARGNSVLLRDIETGIFNEASLDGHTDWVRLVTFSPDGKYIATASDDTTIRIWDSNLGALVGDPLRGHTAFVLAVAFSMDGNQLVSASSDHTVRIWDAKTGNCVNAFEGHTRQVYSAVFSPDASHIVSVSLDKTVRVWNASGGDPVHIFEGHSTPVTFAFFSPDAKHILTCSSNGTIIVWDLETGKEISNSCIDAASLSLSDSESSSYIITPQKFNTSAASLFSSYSFNVAGAGVAGGILDTWLYLAPKEEFIVRNYFGQLTMHKVYTA